MLLTGNTIPVDLERQRRNKMGRPLNKRNLGDTAKVKGSAIFIVGKEGVIGKYGNASSKKQFVQKVRTIFLEQIYTSVE